MRINRFRIGRRGAYLLAKGVLFAGYGLLLGSREARPLYLLLDRMASMRVWSYVWIGVGLWAGIAAFKRKFQPSAFAALMALPTLWALGILASYLLPGPSSGAWMLALLFGSFMLSIAAVAGWREL